MWRKIGTMENRPNIYDIAEEAGVSIAMVSRVMNNTGHVAPAKRLVVQEILKKRSYRPSRAAKSLARKTHEAIGVVVQTGNPLYSQHVISRVLEGVANWCLEQHRYVTLLWGNPDNLHESIRVGSGDVDGLLLCDIALTDALAKDLEACGLPAVSISLPANQRGVSCVLADNRGGGQLALEHLLAMGHQRILLLNGDQKSLAGRHRREGALDALEKTSVTIPDEWDADALFHPTITREIVSRIFSAPSATWPTAIFAASDIMAVAAITTLQSMGIRVPETVSIVGFDDIPLTTMVVPAITTVAQPLEAMGRRAAEILDAETRGTRPGTQLILPVELLKPASVAAPTGTTQTPL